jgi:hypothetical protein
MSVSYPLPDLLDCGLTYTRLEPPGYDLLADQLTSDLLHWEDQPCSTLQVSEVGKMTTVYHLPLSLPLTRQVANKAIVFKIR